MTLEEAKARKAEYIRITNSLDWQDCPDAGGYSVNEMRAVFEKVQNKENWKMPIQFVGILSAEEVQILPYAVPHFTGGHCRIERLENGDMAVIAAGYYECVGA